MKAYFSNLPFIYHNETTNRLKTDWLPLTSPKTGRTLTKQELETNKPDKTIVTIFGDKFRFER